MKSFKVQSKKVSEFVKLFEEAVAGRELGSMVCIQLKEAQVVVTIQKMGTSEMVFSLDSDSLGFKATKTSEKIALVHRPFRAEIEGKIAKVMTSLGAEVLI